ncbi:hypothetical protein EC973_003711 [Apophysomyces ossiformis]|uniref:Uncharacterized protein n=1 Tax=Apophysomyces ossiformis TaxID=679940 RepID=A0A8H7BJ64_9FUNG|nr:hypothetical protein EC973_003711 [Apophysomyces ossiformis]
MDVDHNPLKSYIVPGHIKLCSTYFKSCPASEWSFKSYKSANDNGMNREKHLRSRYNDDLERLSLHPEVPPYVQIHAIYLKNLDWEENRDKSLEIRQIQNFNNAIVKGKARINISNSVDKRKYEEEGDRSEKQPVKRASIYRRRNEGEASSTANGANNIFDTVVLEAPDALNCKWKLGDLDIVSLFHKYQSRNLLEAKRSSLYLESDSQKILSLSYVFLLKPKQNDPVCVEVFGGSKSLEEIHDQFLANYLNPNIELDFGIFQQVLAVTMVLWFKFNIRVEIMVKLYRTPLLEDIGETELTASILDPVLATMFHDPDNDRVFRWWNLNTTERALTLDSSRPDCYLVSIQESMSSCSLGFGEVKPSAHEKNSALLAADLIRTAMFCKNAIDVHQMDAVLGFQAKGPKVTFYLCVLKDGGIYQFGELLCVDLPTSLQSLPALVLELKCLMRVMHAFDKHCRKSANPERIMHDRRPSIDCAILKAIIKQSKDRARQSYVQF